LCRRRYAFEDRREGDICLSAGAKLGARELGCMYGGMHVLVDPRSPRVRREGDG
jgi:hypothetical protein